MIGKKFLHTKTGRLTLLLSGAFLVYLSAFTFNKIYRPSISNKKVMHQAWIERENGDVFISHSEDRQRLKVRAYLDSLDSIESSDSGEALITLEDSTRIRLLPNTLLTFEIIREGTEEKFFFVLKRGEIKLDFAGENVKHVFIAKNGKRLEIENYENSALARESTLPDPSVIQSLRRTDTPQGPSEKDISDLFQRNRSAFFKCYGQLLQRHPKARGEVSLSFIIADSGKTNQVRTSSAQGMKDQDFNKCLTEVVTRMAFKPFQGAPVSTIYPLKFE